MSRLAYFKLTCTDKNTSWHKTPIYFCERCLNSDAHKHLLRDWFIKVEITDQKECCSYQHKQKEASND